jgi:GMP synthase-like glutamine amidotransferase
VPVLGILNCDPEGFGRYSEYLERWGFATELVRAHRGEPLPPWSPFQAILVGGTPLSVYQDHDFLRAESRYLAEAVAAGTPCLGICGGAQLLAQVLGATVRPCEVREIGVNEVRLTAAGREDQVLAGFPERFSVFQWHGDTFGLPQGVPLLVEGEACRNQVFRAGPAVGVQFHLETTPDQAAVWADQYADELALVGRTKGAVVRECEDHEAAMARLAERLLANFLRSVARQRLAV